jgi:hypothetical protein
VDTELPWDMRTLLTTLCVLFLGTVGVRAELTVKQYKIQMSSTEDTVPMAMAKMYVLGSGEGIRVTNVLLQVKGKRLFCAPKNLALGVENFVDILNRSITGAAMRTPQAELDETDISVLLLRGVLETFPCASEKH